MRTLVLTLRNRFEAHRNEWLVMLLLLVASAISCSFIVIRSVMRDQWSYYFLIWNLFLAWIPLVVAFGLRLKQRPSLPLLLIGGAIWLLFLPNAPYILTDIVHFRWSRTSVWLDWSMFLSFALTGLFAGFASLTWMQQIVRERFGRIAATVLVVGSLGASGLGVYIGRFLRWNSWDIVTRPQDLIVNIVNQLTSAETFVHAWSLSAIFAMMFGFCFAMMHLLPERKEQQVPRRNVVLE